jgi:tape measure domain-containing protein
MSRRYTYEFNLKGNFVSKLSKVAGSGQRAYNKLSGMQKVYNSQLDQGNRKLSKMNGLTSKLGTAIGGYIGYQGVKSFFQLGDEITKSKIQFQTFLKDVEKGNALYAKLTKFANMTPYETGHIYKAATTLLSFNVNAKKVLPTLQALGDIAAGDSERLKLLTYAFAQTNATGKLMGNDFHQFTNQGFNPLDILAKKAGKSLEYFQGQMRKGKVSAQDVSNALMIATGRGGLFHGMMDKMSQELSGRWSTVMGKSKNLIAEVSAVQGKRFIPVLNKVIGRLGDVQETAKIVNARINNFANRLGNAISWIQRNAEWLKVLTKVVLTGVLAYKAWNLIIKVKMGLLAIYKSAVFVHIGLTKGWAAAQAALNLQMMLNPVGLIIAGIVALTAAVVIIIKKTNGWADQWQNFREVVGNVWDRLVMKFKLFTGQLALVWEKAKAMLGFGDNDDLKAREDNLRNLYKKQADLKKNAPSLEWKLGWEGGKMPKIPGINKDKDSGSSFVPGTNPGASLVDSGKVTSGVSGIVGGGSKTQNITINVEKLVENITVMSQDLKEGVSDIRDLVQEELLRVLNSANAMTNG